MNEIWRLHDPAALLLLLLIPLRYRASIRRRGKALPFPALEQAEIAGAVSSGRRRHALALLRCIGFALLAFALARPQGGVHEVQRKTDGIDIMVVVDTSGSMEAMDFTVGGKRATRIQAAAQVFKDFIDKREGDRIGIVVFGNAVYTQSPLTTDHGALQQAVRTWRVGLAGAQKTAIGDALSIATTRLDTLESESKVVILLSDGESNAGKMDPIEAAESAKALGVRVYTIAIGTEGRVPFERKNPFTGLTDFVKRRVSFDEATLRSVAEITDGEYFHAGDTDALQQVIDTIDKLETTTVEITEHDRYHEQYHSPLVLGLLFLLAGLGMGMGRGEAWP